MAGVFYCTGVGITEQQLAAMQQRLTDGTSNSPAPAANYSSDPQVILGIDPSLRGTGFGVIDTVTTTPATLTQGTINCPADWPISRCFVRIAETLGKVITETEPTVVAIEGLFYAQNVKTALVMGQARGAAITTVAKAGLEVFEIAPRKVKQAIVGFGAAQKEAVAKMVQTRLGLPELPEPDAADALAIALTFSQSVGAPVPDSAIKPL